MTERDFLEDINYLDWYFGEDDGMADKDAVESYERLRNWFFTAWKGKEAKPVEHIYKEFAEHEWIKNEDGEIDLFANAYEFCNGPVCKRCGYSFCVHCDPDGYTKKSCVIDKYVCPSCYSRLSKYRQERFCPQCGQEVTWDG